MKITIKYKNDHQEESPCWATAILPDGEYLSSCHNTYEGAKEALLNKIRKWKVVLPPPPDEEVEIEG